MCEEKIKPLPGLLLMISSASSPLAEGAEAQVIDQIHSLQIGAETLFRFCDKSQNTFQQIGSSYDADTIDI